MADQSGIKYQKQDDGGHVRSGVVNYDRASLIF